MGGYITEFMGHTFSNNIYHIIFSTKGRILLINDDIRTELYKYICGIARNENCLIMQINGIPNHIHMLVKIKPSLSVSEFLSKIKANSSKWVSDKFQLSYGFQWQGGYSSFTVSKSQVPAIS
ncbi:MAG TPA: IS200/IS605 family transposase [Lentisphaeria bacterium]|nr:IS200/IS605 family transposase [Lentisphaeria bacterium]